MVTGFLDELQRLFSTTGEGLQMILIHWCWFAMIQLRKIGKIVWLSSDNGTWEDGVDTVVVNVITTLAKADNIDTELWWSVATLRIFDHHILWWYPGLCPAFNDLTKVCSIVRWEEQKFQIWRSFLGDDQECLSGANHFYMAVWVQP